jgi:dienelactone hydrolase
MDIYQPAGDTVKKRPLVILAHGGSFYSGNRTDDNTITQLCSDLAHKGYVTVSIDYRLIDNFVELATADSTIVEVLQAVSDGKAVVRYMHEYADSFGIDTSNIYVGGNSAGGVLFMQYAYIDSISELPANFQALLPCIGGTLEGNSGHPGYSSNIKGVISLAGGLNQVSWLGYCSKPIVMAQGTADNVVPYTCANAEGGLVPVTLCGLGSLAPNIVANTPYYDTMTFIGAGHVPWSTNDTDFYMVDTLITGFLYNELTNAVPTTCPARPSGINTIGYKADIKLYPNPAISELNVQSSDPISKISISDETGRIVYQSENINTMNYQIPISGISTGIYFARIYDTMGHLPVTKKVTIE